MTNSPSLDPSGSKTSNENECDQALNEIRLMLRYALAEGLDLDEKTSLLVAAVVDRCHSKTEAAAPSTPPDLSAVLAAHTALAKIVAPATPRSLQNCEPLPGFLGSLRNPPLILWMIVVALIAAIGFIVTILSSPPVAKSSKIGAVTYAPAVLRVHLTNVSLESSSSGSTPSADKAEDVLSVRKELNWFFAAALGAVFFVLFQAHEYVKKRTFDPQYNSLYLIRFVLGVLAGLILANVMATTPLLKGEGALQKLGPSVLALLGGFSTEAVNQVLQRLVEIMLAAVRGDGSDAAKTKATQNAQNELLSLASDPTVMGDQPLLKKVHAAVRKVSQ